MKLLSWGANSYGQLGVGYRSEIVDIPQVVTFDHIKDSAEKVLKYIKSVCGGGGHSLILTENGSVYGCGWNNIGQLGSLKEGVVTKLTKLQLNGHSVDSLASAWDTCYAITKEGKCIGWGSNVYGQLGKPMETVISSQEPIILAQNALQVACGVRHCIILLDNGKLLSAGDYKYGQLGRKVAILDHTFCEVPDLKNVESISCGFNHNLALTSSGKLYGWGVNKWGQLGMDPTNCKWVGKPTCIPINEDYNIKEIHCGWSSSHLLTDDGRLINFGRNTYGQLGNGTTTNNWKPDELKDFFFEKISIGSEHCLGLNEKGKLLSWGWNEHGNCGNGKTENVLKPTKMILRGNKNVKCFEAAVGQNYVITEE